MATKFLSVQEANDLIAKTYGENTIALGQDLEAIFWQFQDEPIDVYHIHYYKEEM